MVICLILLKRRNTHDYKGKSMNFRQKITLHLLLYIALCSAAFAQVVDIPAPNLQVAIRQELQLLPGSRITKEDMLWLERLNAARHDIIDLMGLEHATNLASLSLWGNQLAELTPIANLRRLTYLDTAACSISDISVVSNLVSLTTLNVRFNQIVDISPLANLTDLVSLCYATSKSHTTHRIVPER